MLTKFLGGYFLAATCILCRRHMLCPEQSQNLQRVRSVLTCNGGVVLAGGRLDWTPTGLVMAGWRVEFVSCFRVSPGERRFRRRRLFAAQVCESMTSSRSIRSFVPKSVPPRLSLIHI